MKCSELIQIAAKIIENHGDIACAFGSLPHRPFHSANVSFGKDFDGNACQIALFCSAEDLQVINGLQKAHATRLGALTVVPEA